ncbi:2,5-diamino-6-(ribosylamino)-4(3H)-pyrimidinone 5'-phosphate reductase [Halobacterium sp. R2-5]|uniref:2,5-diamino-6-(ribosylamino)-4(3H)-pyrimidinone 5'-phosphate reductase n=1 Tax=Halobacterium sp. R2-5 TaxID=2715751 RepID=UPI001421D1D7|nr:2,5-diamino-6-(ribosylamino)-4(3H)-pyrimidinone 5'-phosphate reductase [Halobacterium sp. R2-5]NIC00607.1 2,5-diamino-6-(ribosylamino)-4(3H)-pyrimidinone 5'-phosphate reductase [Halobacterium sp. R2-5]
MHVVVNAAMSADGKLSTRRREQVALSGEADFERVDALRASVDAVMVGVGTVLADNPSLTVDDSDLVAERDARGNSPQPARVVADSHARTPPGARVLDGAAQTFVLVAEEEPVEHRQSLEDAGATVVVAGETRVALPEAFAELEAHGVEDLMVEGGGELIFSLFADDLVDELSVFVAPTIIGGRDAPTLADGDGFVSELPELDLVGVERVDDGVLLEYDC